MVLSLSALGFYLSMQLPAAAVALGSIVAILPVPLYLFLALLLDRTEREPIWMLTTAFIWGCTFAVVGSLTFNTLFTTAVGMMFGYGKDVLTASISAPFFEEFFKSIILLFFFFWKKKDFNGIVDGIVYAAMVGLGFAMAENMLYYARSLTSGGFIELMQTVFARGVASAFAHPIFTAMTGIGLGLAIRTTSKFLKKFYPVAGFIGAVILHSTWNSAGLLGRGGFELMYVLIFVPTLLFIIGLVWMLVRKKPDIQGA
tara:strand:- start:7608 stop:8378 length:771 start_codon:yes stop_codon:yes gene_type:complete